MPVLRAPLLVVPSLAAAESDGVDGTSLKYLLKLALQMKKEEEVRKEREEEQRQVMEEEKKTKKALAMLRMMLSPGRQARCTSAWNDDVGVLAARPDRLYEVRPQERVLWRTVEQNVGVFTYPLLDVLEPQMGDQLVEVLRKIDTRSSHQAIEVPKVFPVSAPLRRVESRPPQLAEQLVEVPTAALVRRFCSRLEGLFESRTSTYCCRAAGRREWCS